MTRKPGFPIFLFNERKFLSKNLAEFDLKKELNIEKMRMVKIFELSEKMKNGFPRDMDSILQNEMFMIVFIDEEGRRCKAYDKRPEPGVSISCEKK